MSQDWVKDVHDMHEKFGFHGTVATFTPEQMRQLLDHRHEFLKEEMRELAEAIEARDGHGVADALVDICVVAIGTMDLFDLPSNEYWDEVHDANMAKERGVKPGRKSVMGMDLRKPEGWVAPGRYWTDRSSFQRVLDWTGGVKLVRDSTAAECRYGEGVVALYGDWEVVDDRSYADYQGQVWLVARKRDLAGGDLYVHVEFSYGSCSGCDDWEARDLSDEAIVEEIRDKCSLLMDVETFKEWSVRTDRSTMK